MKDNLFKLNSDEMKRKFKFIKILMIFLIVFLLNSNYIFAQTRSEMFYDEDGMLSNVEIYADSTVVDGIKYKDNKTFKYRGIYYPNVENPDSSKISSKVYTDYLNRNLESKRHMYLEENMKKYPDHYIVNKKEYGSYTGNIIKEKTIKEYPDSSIYHTTMYSKMTGKISQENHYAKYSDYDVFTNKLYNKEGTLTENYHLIEYPDSAISRQKLYDKHGVYIVTEKAYGDTIYKSEEYKER